MTKTTNRTDYRGLNEEDVSCLINNGCRSTDWNTVFVTEETELNLIRNVEFTGVNKIGRLDRTLRKDARIENAALKNCRFGDDVCVRNIGDRLENIVTGDCVTIVNTAAITYNPETFLPNGIEVEVLDETGKRPVSIYPGISAQLAALCIYCPQWAKENLFDKIQIGEILKTDVTIGDGAYVANCGEIDNVYIDRGVSICGAARLVNGLVVNNVTDGKPLARVGTGVDAENFIFEDAEVAGASIVRSSYIGQGTVVDKRAAIHDSLLFANCMFENGEMCAVFAAPYTVSMHKSTLLIGSMVSFFNAGSGTNQSNHMYKMGPAHWGIMERGVKTSSNAYVMWGARIGAFSLLMGSHKYHPDTSDFPFSYLFGDETGATTVVPGIMLRSCGLERDSRKWPTRDRRSGKVFKPNDRIVFDVLNPYTVGKILKSIQIIQNLLENQTDAGKVLEYNGLKIKVSVLQRAAGIYEQAIFKYLDSALNEGFLPEDEGGSSEWVDLAGQILPREAVERVKQCGTVEEMESVFNDYYENYGKYERNWIANALRDYISDPQKIKSGAAEFDRQIEADRAKYISSVEKEQNLLEL